MEKCPHGVYLAGETTARYCAACNPAFTASVRGLPKQSYVPPRREREMDAADFLAQPIGFRLANGGERV